MKPSANEAIIVNASLEHVMLNRVTIYGEPEVVDPLS